MKNDIIAVLLMVKNESESIGLTIESTKIHFDEVIVFDTGSTDDTVNIIRETCAKTKQTLHLKEGQFKSFPESRNDALDFAEKATSCAYILMMDAGDEFKTSIPKREFCDMFKSVPSHLAFDIGIIKQKWLDSASKGLSDHFDCRLIKNHKGIRYDLRFPVHEQVCNASQLASSNFGDNFHLYQDRIKYGGSSTRRYTRDIELLSKAVANKRNLYFLAQSYMSVEDFKNGYKYNVLSYQCKNDDDCNFHDEKFTLVRIAFCAMKSNMTSIAIKYLEKLLNEDEVPVDAYVYLLDIHIKKNECEKVIKHVDALFNLEKPSVSSSIKLVNHYFYDYLRFHLISIVCLMTKQKLDIGRKAIEIAVKFDKPDDRHNYGVYRSLLGS